MLKEPLIGTHFSAAGGVFNAVKEAFEYGATTLQLFTSNQKQWRARTLSDETIEKFIEAVKDTGMQKIMSHSSYLINLGSPKEELRQKSIGAFKEEIKRCTQLHIAYCNFHPGAATGSEIEDCLDTICDSLLECQKEANHNHAPRLLLETTAGQGTSVGHAFEHLAHIINKVKTKIPIGVCIDTCHIFAAGYDIRHKKAWDATLQQFDHVVGLEHLYGIHVNDSKMPFGSRRDRHANLGKGEIGIEGFKAMMQHSKLKNLPKYLETPNGETHWKQEIQQLFSFAEK